MLGFPALILAVPPLMISVPAIFTLGVEFAAPVIGFVAVLAMVPNGLIQSGFGFLDGVPARVSIVGVHARRGHQQEESHGCDSGYGGSCKLSIQSTLLSSGCDSDQNFKEAGQTLRYSASGIYDSRIQPIGGDFR
jgi:hypothetical protein